MNRNVRKRTFWRASNEDSNQPARSRSLISVFVVRMKKLCNLGYPKMRPVKILIRLRECADWSESSLGAKARWYVFWRCGSDVWDVIPRPFQRNCRRRASQWSDKNVTSDVDWSWIAPIKHKRIINTDSGSNCAVFSAGNVHTGGAFFFFFFFVNLHFQKCFGTEINVTVDREHRLQSIWRNLTLSTLGKIFSRRHFEIFFLFFPENRIWHFMQIVS